MDSIGSQSVVWWLPAQILWVCLLNIAYFIGNRCINLSAVKSRSTARRSHRMRARRNVAKKSVLQPLPSHMACPFSFLSLSEDCLRIFTIQNSCAAPSTSDQVHRTRPQTEYIRGNMLSELSLPITVARNRWNGAPIWCHLKIDFPFLGKSHTDADTHCSAGHSPANVFYCIQ